LDFGIPKLQSFCFKGFIKIKLNISPLVHVLLQKRDDNKPPPFFISLVSLLRRPELERPLSRTSSNLGCCLSVNFFILKEMSEQKKPPKSRVFFVGMKLLHKPGNKPLQEKNSFFHTYYKWVLWLSLSLYFFTSYLITTNPNTAPTSPNTSSHVSNSESHAVPRAVIDSTTNSLGGVTLHTRQHFQLTNGLVLEFISTRFVAGVLKNLKMFVYELPPKFNTGWLANKRCSNHLFASEVAIHRALLTSEVRTFDPYEADFFFVPVYVSCNFSAVNGFPAIGHARSIISSAVNLVSTEYPFWNRSKGRDHVFVASHDFGACFHSLVKCQCPTSVEYIV